MAMAAVVAGLAAGGAGSTGGGASLVEGFEAVATSYPGFLADLEVLGGPAHGGTAAGGPAHGGTAAGGPAHGGTAGIIAIDGPAGSGKSTVSRALAARLGIARLDTGAMYRAVAWAALRRGVDAHDREAVAALAANSDIDLEDDRVLLDGHDITAAIRSPEVNHAVSLVAANPAVRREMVERQRSWAGRHGGGVVEGRDIGTVVFPDAGLKVFLTASAEERSRRRSEETPEGVARRDHLDSTRDASPLSVADGAHVIDTTGRSVSDVVDAVLSWL